MATAKPARAKRAKWDVAVVGGIPQGPAVAAADGKPDKSAIARAQLGASAVLQKINQVLCAFAPGTAWVQAKGLG